MKFLPVGRHASRPQAGWRRCRGAAAAARLGARARHALRERPRPLRRAGGLDAREAAVPPRAPPGRVGGRCRGGRRVGAWISPGSHSAGRARRCSSPRCSRRSMRCSPPSSPRCGCRSCSSSASCSCSRSTPHCCSSPASCCRTTSASTRSATRCSPSLVIAAVVDRAAVVARDQRRRRVHPARDPADRPPPGRARAHGRPGLIYLEIDGLALPMLRRAMRDGSAPAMARWVAEDGYRLAEWETDLSSQTGASQAGILLGSNEDIAAFRWVEKEHGRDDGVLLARGLRGDRAPPRRPASACSSTVAPAAATCSRARPRTSILTVSRIEAEKQGQPRLPRVPRQRLQRHAHVRAVPVRGRARGDRGAARERGATCGREGTAAASIRSCGRRCA